MSAVARIVERFAPWLADADYPEPLLAAVVMPVRRQATLDRADRDEIVERVLAHEDDLLNPESSYFPSPDFPAEFEAFKRLPVK